MIDYLAPRHYEPALPSSIIKPPIAIAARVLAFPARWKKWRPKKPCQQ
jgi:hypothetical protein